MRSASRLSSSFRRCAGARRMRRADADQARSQCCVCVRPDPHEARRDAQVEQVAGEAGDAAQREHRPRQRLGVHKQRVDAVNGTQPVVVRDAAGERRRHVARKANPDAARVVAWDERVVQHSGRSRRLRHRRICTLRRKRRTRRACDQQAGPAWRTGPRSAPHLCRRSGRAAGCAEVRLRLQHRPTVPTPRLGIRCGCRCRGGGGAGCCCCCSGRIGGAGSAML